MKTRKSLRLFAALLLVLALLSSLLAGCGQASSGNSKEYKFAWYASAPHPYFEKVKAGVEAFEKDTGIEVYKQVGPDWKQSSENDNIEALAAKGYKYFTIYPNDPSAANALIEELDAKKISVINFGTSTFLPTKAKFYVGTDVKSAAMQATERLIKLMGEKGNIINVLEILEDANTKLRKEGIEEVVSRYPNVKIIQEISDMQTVEEAVEKIDNAISANIDSVDGLIATGSTTTVGIAQVLTELKERGFDRRIYSIGQNIDPIVDKAIREGIMDAVVAENTFGHGYLPCMLLKYLAEGWIPKEGAYNVDAQIMFVTKENIDSYESDLFELTKEITKKLETDYLQKK